MLEFLLRRLGYALVVMLAISVVGFTIIQLPPGDFLSSYIAELEATGAVVDEQQIEALRVRYGLDLPAHLQYFKWMGNMLQGDFGLSFRWNLPVRDLIGDRLALTAVISIATLTVSYILAILFGIYSATRQYGFGDYLLTFFAFIGLALPNFLLALVLMYLFHSWFGMSVVGLFSPEYVGQPWSFGKFIDLLKHLPIPVIVVGTAGIAGLFRVMRGSLLDELRQQYVTAARGRGISEMQLLFRYPVKVALNPIISTVGWVLPQIVSGAAIVAIVLGLPTVGPLFLEALRTQDMYLAGTLMTFLAFLTVIGTFLSDILLMWVDPRIRIR